MKSALLLALAFLTCFSLGMAAPAPAALRLQKGDVRSVALELEPDALPALRIFFTNRKLLETQALIEANLNAPIDIFMNDKLVVTPRIKSPLLYKNKFVVLKFPDFATAATAARLLIPTP